MSTAESLMRTFQTVDRPFSELREPEGPAAMALRVALLSLNARSMAGEGLRELDGLLDQATVMHFGTQSASVHLNYEHTSEIDTVEKAEEFIETTNRFVHAFLAGYYTARYLDELLRGKDTNEAPGSSSGGDGEEALGDNPGL